MRPRVPRFARPGTRLPALRIKARLREEFIGNIHRDAIPVLSMHGHALLAKIFELDELRKGHIEDLIRDRYRKSKINLN